MQDPDHTTVLDSFGDVADGAEEVEIECVEEGSDDVHGEVWAKEGWSVVVTGRFLSSCL